MIVTIDGPAGAGKSTAARTLAHRLGFEFLDTGAMYRAVTYASLRDGIDAGDTRRLEAWLPTIRFDARPEIIRLDSQDVSDLIRTPEVSAAASRVAAIPAVRSFLVGIQRQ